MSSKLWKSALLLSDIYWRLSVTDPWRLPTLFYSSGVLGELVTPVSTFHSFLKTHSQKQTSLAPPSPELPSSVLASWVGWGPKNKDSRQTNFSIFCSFFPPNLKSEFLRGPVAWLWGRYPVYPKSSLVFHGFFLSLTRNMHGKPLYFSTKSQHLLWTHLWRRQMHLGGMIYVTCMVKRRPQPVVPISLLWHTTFLEESRVSRISWWVLHLDQNILWAMERAWELTSEFFNC